mmetsp:Transcript_7867/g.23414  ORF Transcript_7867/g.23414 Transcript_7867/m.23414 type:complete len:357 (-) Transcript_7867:44-1114(-)
MPRPVLAAALAFAALAAAARPPSNRTARVVIFKHGRTGSTWMADLLKQQPAVAFFEHEANGCLKRLGSISNYRAMLSIVAAPTCDMACDTNTTRLKERFPELPPWVRPLPVASEETPACLRGKLVGFDVQPDNDFSKIDGGKSVAGEWPGEPNFLTWHEHWAPLLRRPRVAPVLYVRSNLVKHAMSKARAHLLTALCDGTHKVKAGSKAEACVKAHESVLHGPVVESAWHIAATGHYLAEMWRDLLEHIREASGRPRFLILYYERFQTDPVASIGDLFAYAGLPRSAVVGNASAADVKLSSDDLRQGIANFSAVEADLALLDPCLLPQLRDAGHAVFPDLCLKEGSASFDDYQAAL